ncbi:unnamed protein product [Closterium sp. NIES-65]|nr:unnamed protein product [Closterium sp. NIES-65]
MEASVTPAWKAQARTHATAISTASTANSSLAASAYVSSAVPKAQHHHSQRRGAGFLCPRSRIVYMRAPFTRPHRRHVPSVLVPSRSGRRGRGDGLKCDVLVPGCPSPGELSEGEGENSRGPDGLRWRRGQRGSARSENLAVEQQAEEKPDNWDFVGSSGDSSGSGDEGSNPHEFTFSAENSVMVDQVRMLQHIHSCAHAEEDLAGGDARGIMRATAGGMKPRVLKASTPIRDIYKSEGPIDEDVVCMQADWPLTWTHITLATGVSVGSGIAGPEDVTMLTQATTCTAILCLQGEESLESFGVNWKAVQEQAEQCDVAMFRVPVPEFDQQKQVAGMVEAVRLLASLLVTGHRVHVACATGKNCSPLVVLGYLTFFQGLAWSEAKAMIVDSVPSADPSHEAWEQLVLSAADGVGPHKRSGQDDGAGRGAVPAPHIAGRAFPFSTPCPAGALSSGRGGRAQDDRASRGAVPAPHRAGRGRYTMPHPLTPSTHSPISPLSSPLPYSLPRPGSSGAVSSGRGGRTQDDRTSRGEVPAAHRAGRTFPLSTLPAYFPCLPSPIPCLPLPGPAGAVSSGRGGRTQDDRASRGALPAAHRAGRGGYTMLQPPTPSLSPPPSSGITQARLVLSAADGVGAHRMTELAEEQYQRRIEQGAGAEGGGQTARDDWEEAQRRLITETLQHRVSADVTISQSLSKAASRQASSPKPREVQPREAQSFSPVVDSQMAPPLETPFQVPPTSLQHRVYADVAISQSLPKAASRQASSPKPREVQPREAQSFSPVVDSQIAPPLDTPFQQQPHILDSVYSFVNDHHSHAWPLAAPPPADAPPAIEEGVLGEGVLDGEGVVGEVSSGVEERIALLEQKHLAAMAAARSATEQVRFFMQHVSELRESETAARMEAAAAHERIALLTAQVEALNLFQQQQQQQQEEERQQREKEQQEQREQQELQAAAFLGVDSAAAAAAAAASAEATAAAMAAAAAEAEAAAAAAAERESALHSQLTEVSQELSLLQERERELLSAHEAAEAKAQAAEERAADLANRIAQMEEMEAAAKEAAAVALERMQALAEQVKELSEKERAASARMGEMETRLEEASEKAAADHDLMVKLEDRAERAEKEARKAQEALGAANERVKFFFRVMRGLRDRERAAKEAMHAATDRLEAAVTEAENLRRKDELMREAWAVASERIELLTRQVQQVEGLKMEVKREAVDAAKVFLHESDEHRLMAAREELSAAEERERMLQAQLERLGAELAAARDDMAERDARLAAVAAEVAERERVVEESRAAIGAAEKRIKELEEQVGVVEERERKAKREAEEAEAVLAAALAAAETKDREYTLMETPQKTAAAAAAGAVSAVAAAAGASSAAGAAASGAADQLIARLQSQVAAMSSELEGARNAAAAASERSAFLMRQVARLKGTAAADAVSRSQGGSGGGKGEGSSSKHRVAALEVEIRALEKRERAARAEAEAEKARVRELAAQVGQLESKERAAREKLQSSQDRVGFFLRQAVELREREGASKSALKETFKKVEGLSHQVGLLQGELVRASKESGKSTDAVERLQLLTMELKEKIHETSRVASSIKKVPGSSKVNGFERSGAGLGVLKAPELTASNAAAAASNASSNGAASAAASKGVITGKGKEEKKDDDNDDFPGGSGSGGGGVGGRGVSAQGKASSSGSRAGSPSFGALVGPSY